MTYRPYYPQPPYPPAYGPGPRHRSSAPFSVHVAAFFIYLGGILVLLGAAGFGLLAAGSTQLPAGQLPEDAAGMVAGAGVVVAVILLLIAVLYFLIARKLQKGRQWARVLVLIFAVLGLLGAGLQTFAVLSQIDPTPVVLGSLAAGFLGPILFIVLLNTSAARSWFRHRTY
ncbi:MAG: hypothetical protein ACRDT4_04950 [Micromonosporaceae bacterium]